MSGQLLISLLSPTTGIILFAAFFVLWLRKRELSYILTASFGYLLTAFGFLFQDTLPVWSLDAQRIASNLCFLLGVATIFSAPLQRNRLGIPWVSMTIILIAAMAILIWYLLADPNLVARIVVASIALNFMIFLPLRRFYSGMKERFSDRLLLWVMIFCQVLFIVRPLMAFWTPHGTDTYNALDQSTYWGLVHFSFIVMAITISIALMVCVSLDLMDELKREAVTDSLSKLSNRRGFEEDSARAIQRSKADGTSIALLLADLDRFKSINDLYGHGVGDEVIRDFGQLIQSLSDSKTVAGRIGGEEFAVLLPEATRESAQAFADNLCEQFAQRYQDNPNFTSSTPTTSIGLVIASNEVDLSRMLNQADKALYTAKNQGRNRSEWYQDSTIY